MSLPALLFCVLIGVVILFQLALAAGLPWGKAAMGGRFPGKLPTMMRILSLAQVVLLLILALIVLARARIILPEWYAFAQTAIWGVVVFSALSTVLNLITPSKVERAIWAPIAAGLTILSIIIAVG